MESIFRLKGFELEAWDKFMAQLKAELRSGMQGTINKSFKQWANMYLRYLFQRYNRYSMGGGDWAPSAKSTNRKKGGRQSILIESYALRDAISPHYRGPGQTQTRYPNGIKVGYGRGKHPRSRLSYQSLAELHATGFTTKYGGIVPPRQIVVPPTSQLANQMKDVLVSNLREHLRKNKLGS